MNIETRIDNRLWMAIKSNFESRQFSGVILDSTYFLNDLIREKSGLESDGVSLVGNAFGGVEPLLKVNKMQTESEKNEQKGLEQILRGIITAIRNPRSHQKYNDSQSDAEAVIIFIDYLINVIDRSKSPFSKTEFLSRVFDENFVENNRYAELLAEEIPLGKVFEILVDVYNQKDTGNGQKLGYFVKMVLKRLNSNEYEQFYHIVSEELKRCQEIKTVRTILQILPKGDWNKIQEVSRLRTENILLNDTKDGKYNDERQSCDDGSLGTWSAEFLEYFTTKQDFMDTLINKLGSDNRDQQDYVFRFFSSWFITFNGYLHPRLKRVINLGLKNGDKRFLDAIEFHMETSDNEEWIGAFKVAFDHFCEVEPIREVVYESDDIPF